MKGNRAKQEINSMDQPKTKGTIDADDVIVIRWKTRYIRQLMKRGLSKDMAIDNYNAGHPYNHSIEPEGAADDELSYCGD